MHLKIIPRIDLCAVCNSIFSLNKINKEALKAISDKA
jgi:hypothetical protein